MDLNDQNTGLILIDFINDIVDPKGKLAGKGYSRFIERHEVLAKLQRLLSAWRASNRFIAHVRVGFSPGYIEHPASSPLFGGAKKFSALELGTWGTEFHPTVLPKMNEPVVVKHRVSAFYATSLDLVLRTNGISRLVICGVATDLAVQSTVRDAHDRDYLVYVLRDCCAAASDQDHEQSLQLLSKIASVESLDSLGLDAPVQVTA